MLQNELKRVLDIHIKEIGENISPPMLTKIDIPKAFCVLLGKYDPIEQYSYSLSSLVLFGRLFFCFQEMCLSVIAKNTFAKACFIRQFYKKKLKRAY